MPEKEPKKTPSFHMMSSMKVGTKEQAIKTVTVSGYKASVNLEKKDRRDCQE